MIKVPGPRGLLLAGRFVVDALFQVCAGAEVLAGCRKHDAAAIPVVIEGLQQ